MINISEIVQGLINNSGLNGEYFHVLPLVKNKKDIILNHHEIVKIEIGENCGDMKNIPGYNKLIETLGFIEIDDLAFTYASTYRKGKVLTLYFRVQMGTIKDRVPKVKPEKVPEPEPEPEPESEPGPTEIKPVKKKNKYKSPVNTSFTEKKEV